jgi:alkylhydroperoxidase/carboxymuconolactone decarboxylase family protein YurZ
MSEDFEKGLQVFRKVYGDEAADGCRKGAESDDDFTALHIKFSMELPFGQIWTREEQLSRRDRSLVVLGMCIGQRAFEEIKYHTIMGVANGLTRAEIEEVFFSSIPYCGFPAANTAKAAISEGFRILEEQGKL